MNTKFVTLEEVSALKTDARGIEYKTLTFSAAQSLKTVNTSTGEEIEVLLRPKTATLNVFANSQDGPNADLFNAQAGKLYAGDIVQREVAPYSIQGRGTQGIIELNTYKTPVLGDTTDPGYESLVISAFKRNKRQILGTEVSPDNAADVPRTEVVKPTESAVPVATEEAAW